MPLDPVAKGLLDQMAAAGGPALHEQTPQQAREMMVGMAAMQGAPEPVGSVMDTTVPGPGGAIPIRVYYPSGTGPHPVLIYYHGGGWVIGNIETHDALCRTLCNAVGSAVIAVDYRLAPEHKYPAAAEDSYAVARWVHAQAARLQIDPARIALGGDSAGGNLTAAVCLMAKERGGPPILYQVPVYPVTNHDYGTVSYRDNADGYLLTKAAMEWFWDLYLAKPEDGKEPHASPLQAKDLGGLPPALVITAEFDPLRDEGEAYAHRLQQAGVPTTCHRYDGMIHGFFQFGGVMPQGAAAVKEVAAHLKKAFKIT